MLSMTVCVCLDDNNGVMFNHRRQSQDRIQRERVIQLAKDSVLWMTPYTLTLYRPQLCSRPPIFIARDFDSPVAEDAFCIIEGACPANLIKKANRVVIYRWNRIYPADITFDMRLLAAPVWRLVNMETFNGSSHKEMTEEIWERANPNEKQSI